MFYSQTHTNIFLKGKFIPAVTAKVQKHSRVSILKCILDFSCLHKRNRTFSHFLYCASKALEKSNRIKYYQFSFFRYYESPYIFHCRHNFLPPYPPAPTRLDSAFVYYALSKLHTSLQEIPWSSYSWMCILQTQSSGAILSMFQRNIQYILNDTHGARFASPKININSLEFSYASHNGVK